MKSNEITPSILKQHLDELVCTLGVVEGYIQRYSQRPMRPLPRSHMRVAYGSCSSELQLRYDIRKIHDFYGWRSWGDADNRGKCSGALYRSEAFLSIPRDARQRTKINKGIHIEHTVPVASLARLPFSSGGASSPHANFRLLMQRSVCTACSYQEELHLMSAPRHPPVGSDSRPFIRYVDLHAKTGLFAIYNIVTGSKIDLSSFTFDDHLATLRQASRVSGGAACAPCIYDLEQFTLVQSI